MDAKEYLQQIRNINIKISIIQDEITEIRSLLGARGISYDNQPIISSSNDRVFTLIMKLIDKQNDLVEEYHELSEKRAEIKEVIYQLEDNREIEIIYRRYFRYEQMESIADKLGYSIDYLYTIHRSALRNVEKILEKSEKSL